MSKKLSSIENRNKIANSPKMLSENLIKINVIKKNRATVCMYHIRTQSKMTFRSIKRISYMIFSYKHNTKSIYIKISAKCLKKKKHRLSTSSLKRINILYKLCEPEIVNRACIPKAHIIKKIGIFKFFGFSCSPFVCVCVCVCVVNVHKPS